MSWINLIAPKALDIAKGMTLSPDAKALLAANPNASAGEFAEALASENLNADAVSYLSRGMKPQAGVQWASESAAKVAPKLPPSEVKAAELAKGWTQGQVSPRALDASLAKNPPAGPGTWSAQAASFASQAPTTGAPTELTSRSVAGSVHLSAAVDSDALQMMTPAVDGMPAVPVTAPAVPIEPGMPAMTLPSELTPPQMAQINESLEPFVDLGMEIAQGQTPTATLPSAGTSALQGMMPGMPTLPV